MNKKIIIISIITVLLIIAIVSAGYFYWAWSKKSVALKSLENSGATTNKIMDDATKGVLPSLETDALKNKPDINPADNANPIKNIKINPFE